MGKAVDLTGQRFGKLLVLRKTEKRGAGGSIVWKCRCDCGKECETPSNALRTGHSTTCGCSRKHDLKGKKFRKLLVIEQAENKGEKIAWRCRCDCGKETVTTTGYLLDGTTSSCGCLRIKHMGVGTRIYRTWKGIRNRCKYPSFPGWQYYGGKGVRVCDEWTNSFEAFRDWSMENGYGPELQIDRIDSSGDYCPENCRWVTALVNMRNRDVVILDEEKVFDLKRKFENGETKGSLAEHYGVNESTVSDALSGRTWKDVE
ncbi:MAG: hypothetical protein KAJ90_07110 [Desulfobacterales bacterium]|nr:hypothetical protein [Desulfobacterales bacterium]